MDNTHTNSIESINDNKNNNNDNEINIPEDAHTTDSLTKITKLIYYFYENIPKITFMSILIISLIDISIGLNSYGEVGSKLTFIPIYLMVFGLTSFILTLVHAFLEDKKLSEKMNNHFIYIISLVKRLPIEDQIHYKQEIDPIKTSKIRIETVDYMQTSLISVFKRFLEASLATLFIHALITIYNTYSFVSFDSVNSIFYCPSVCYYAAFYHVIFLSSAGISFCTISFGYLISWFFCFIFKFK
jgi:hypothetical protein